MASLRWRAPASRRFGRLPASCRACVETACGPMSMPSVRPTAHDPVRRFPPPGPVGPVPRLRRYHQRTPTSRRPSRRTSSPSLGGTTGRPVRAADAFASRGGGHSPGAGTHLYGGRPRAASPVETARPPRFPGDPSPACPALRPRRNRRRPAIPGAPVLPSAHVTASASTIRTVSGLYRCTDTGLTEHYTPAAVCARIPGAVLCLLTAIERTEFEGVPARTTSPARTVVDCFRFRRIVGIDVALVAMREALAERKRRQTRSCAQRRPAAPDRWCVLSSRRCWHEREGHAIDRIRYRLSNSGEADR